MNCLREAGPAFTQMKKGEGTGNTIECEYQKKNHVYIKTLHVCLEVFKPIDDELASAALFIEYVHATPLEYRHSS